MPITLLTANTGRTPAPTEINRIGGVPIGVDETSWPYYDDRPMSHVLTVDLRELKLPIDPRYRALAVFVASPEDNEAFEPYTPHARVLLLTDADLKRGEPKVLPELEPEEMLPAAAVEFAPADDEADPEDLFKRSFAGGEPIWLQGDEYYERDWGDDEDDPTEQRGIGTFVLQFGEELIPMNLGDSGVMYVFTDTAWWQCY